VKVTVLGCGASLGVPIVGGSWGLCDPDEPKNRRRRASILVEEGGTTLLIDTSPDMRMQLLDAGVGSVDAVLWTHPHADHLHGINDLRGLSLTGHKRVPGYAGRDTLDEIHRAFGYIVAGDKGYRPILEAHEITGPFRIGPLAVTPFQQEHQVMKTLGFRFGAFAYSTDVVELDEAAFAALAGVRVWMVDCLREEPHPTHSHLARSLDWIARLRPERAVLTHMSHHADYRTLTGKLPAGVELAYDGMVLDI
jgi:phosphoribosyl 1,2-cyclic phosphate phosphodiesterase